MRSSRLERWRGGGVSANSEEIPGTMRPLRVLTWHVHGNYLLYLAQANVEFYLPVKPGRPHGYGGRGTTFPFGPNVHEVPAAEVAARSFDCILFQSRRHYEI